MTPQDKQRLKDAFATAINNLGASAQEPVEGIADKSGKTLTRGELLQMMSDSEVTYKAIDDAVASGKKTIDGFVAEIKQAGKPPRAPKP